MPLYRCQGKWATQTTACRPGSIWYRTFPELTAAAGAGSCQRPKHCCCQKALLGSLSPGVALVFQVVGQ